MRRSARVPVRHRRRLRHRSPSRESAVRGPHAQQHRLRRRGSVRASGDPWFLRQGREHRLEAPGPEGVTCYFFSLTSIFVAMLPPLSTRYDTVTSSPFNVARPATVFWAPVTTVESEYLN